MAAIIAGEADGSLDSLDSLVSPLATARGFFCPGRWSVVSGSKPALANSRLIDLAVVVGEHGDDLVDEADAGACLGDAIYESGEGELFAAGGGDIA